MVGLMSEKSMSKSLTTKASRASRRCISMLSTLWCKQSRPSVMVIQATRQRMSTSSWLVWKRWQLSSKPPWSSSCNPPSNWASTRSSSFYSNVWARPMSGWSTQSSSKTSRLYWPKSRLKKCTTISPYPSAMTTIWSLKNLTSISNCHPRCSHS